MTDAAILDTEPRRCAFGPPSRVWFPVGDGMWSSREWDDGERECYQREVLGWR